MKKIKNRVENKIISGVKKNQRVKDGQRKFKKLKNLEAKKQNKNKKI